MLSLFRNTLIVATLKGPRLSHPKQVGLILDTYCAWYGHAMPFLIIFFGIFKTPETFNLNFV